MAFIRVFGLLSLQFLLFLQILIVIGSCNLGFYLVFLPCCALKCIKKSFFSMFNVFGTNIAYRIVRHQKTFNSGKNIVNKL